MSDKRRFFDRDTRERDGFHGSDGGRYGKDTKYDDPPNSRLFIVCGKTITEEDFRDAFEKFGSIEEIWVVKDRLSQEPKGVTYIKFSKTSEAALAMEEMNGRCIGSHPRPLKVLIAHSRDQGSKREMNEEERLLRLFVVVSKTLTESELREQFQQFGDIDYVSIVRDRNTKESKGFAYVKYHRVSHAAKAFEGCERTFKPVFADPKPPRSSYHDNPDRYPGPPMSSGPMSSAPGSSASSSAYDMLAYNYHPPISVDTTQANPDGCSRLNVISSPTLNQDQLWRLFDLIPGLDYCDLRRDPKSRQNRGFAAVVYNNPQSATYAKEKLHGFEYPPGQRLIVKYESGYHNDIPSTNGQFGNVGPRPSHPMHQPPMMPAPQASPSPYGPPSGPPRMPAMPPAAAAASGHPVQGARTGNLQSDLATLAETIAQATSLIQAAGLGQGHGAVQAPSPPNISETYDPSYCSVKLASPQPLAPMDSQVAERLFIVCHPSPPPIYALKDVFGRFGNLIDIYMLNGKTCGYAKYAHKDSAERAIMTLHGQEVCGARLKVMPADPHEKADSGRKRIRIDDQ